MSSRKKKEKETSPVLRVLKTVLLVLLAAILCAGGFLLWKVYPELKTIRQSAISTYTNMNESDFKRMTDTEVFDSDDKRVGSVSAGHYVYVALSDISENIRKAYVDQEDRRFYTHGGVDFVAMARALLSYIKHHGTVTQGASTITQQVIKNTYLTQERTLERKLTEIMIAPELEKQFGKDKILEFYCNGNYYAHGCYGVEAASRYYFGKNAKDVEPWEAALLVGISNRPSAYDPVKNPDAAKKKRNEVLNSMYVCKDITGDELKEYQAKDLSLAVTKEAASPENYQTSYAIHCAALELMKNDGFQFEYSFEKQDAYLAYEEKYKEAYSEKSDQIRAGGFKIHTSLNSTIQDLLQTHLDDVLKKKTETQENGKFALQGAAAVVNNDWNTVVAIVGGRGTNDEYNRGFLSSRQPGSTIKPLIDYGPAFETGVLYPSYMINDHKWDKGPSNSGDNYYGYVSIREALNRSLNTVAWQVLDRIGTKTGLSYLSRLQFSTLSWADMTAPAVSIGGFTNGVHVVDMAKGYAAIANGGVYSDKTCIQSIIYDKTGEEMYSGSEQKTQVFTEGTAYMLTDILKGTMDKEYGTGYGLDISGQQAAGKTGTTNSSKDTWFCGYTKYYTTAVWVGYDTPRAMPGIYGSTYAGKIWHDVMTDLHVNVPQKDWEQPSTVIKGFIDPGNGRQIDWDSGVTDLFNTALNPKAVEEQKARDASSGTTEEAYNPDASDESSETTEESSSVEVLNTTNESAENESTGIVHPSDYGPGVVKQTTARESSGSGVILESPGHVTAEETSGETVSHTNAETVAPAENDHTHAAASTAETKGPGN